MKNFNILLLNVLLLGAFSMRASAQCPLDVNVDNITRPVCGSSNGQFSVEVHDGAASIDISIDSTLSYQTTVSGTQTYTNLTPGLYHIFIRQTATPGIVCQSFDFLLRGDYDAAFTHISSPSSGCHNGDGSILLGSIAGTDSVSWLSSYNPVSTVVSSLSGGNTITGLVPGLYYVTVKGTGNAYCYTTDTVTVGNTGIACPAPTFCGNATDPNNLFPDGNFGSGGDASGTLAQYQGGQLPVGKTQYQYQPLGPYSPEDGFYTIANNSYVGPYPDFYNPGNGTDYTPFGNGWYDGYDHDYYASGGTNVNGYQLIINADYDPNIVIEDTVNNLCVGKTYQFSAYIRSLDINTGDIPTNVTFLIDGIGLYNTGNIEATSDNDWIQVGFTFIASSTSAIMSLRNNSPGGTGSDFALDDIYVGSCAPTIAITPLPADLCDYPEPNDSALVTDQSDLFIYYQWQVDKQDGNGYVDVSGGPQTGVFGTAGANAYYATTPLPIPLLGAGGWTYRLLAATGSGNLSSPSCSFISLDSSTIPTCTTLPVTFIDAEAVLNGSAGHIYWQVGSQLNVDHYEVEKSIDQQSYSYVTAVPVINGSSVLNYQAVDYNLAVGPNYYRIKAVNADGTYSYSNVFTIMYGLDNVIRVSSPVTDILTIFTPPTTNIKQAVIFDAIGRTVLEQNDLNNTLSRIDVGRLSPGFYNIQIITTDGVISNYGFIKNNN